MTTRTCAVNAQGIAEPFHIDEVPWREFGHGERFGIKYQDLSEFGGASQIAVCNEVLAPGKQANQAHYHLLEEEHLLVLEGRMTLRLGAAAYEVGPGSYICFPAGQRAAHSLTNHTDAPCRYLIIGNVQKHDVMVYPDTQRVHVKLTGESYRNSPTLDYWDGVPD